MPEYDKYLASWCAIIALEVRRIATLYIDIYFLINFTVDYLSLYFASSLLGTKTTLLRILLSALLGGALPCVLVLFSVNSIFYIPIYILWLVMVSVICPIKTSYVVCIKLICLFSVIQTLFGGAVSFLFDKLEGIILPLLSEESASVENTEIILLSAIIALVYCVFKLLRIVLGASVNKSSATLRIGVLDTSITLSGLIDSGSFIKDPFDLNPVIIIKEESLKQGIEILKHHAITEPENPLSRRIRIIPVKGVCGDRILYGFKPDSLEIQIGKRRLQVNSTIAIDTEGTSFNDCDAIIPLFAIT